MCKVEMIILGLSFGRKRGGERMKERKKETGIARARDHKSGRRLEQVRERERVNAPVREPAILARGRV